MHTVPNYMRQSVNNALRLVIQTDKGQLKKVPNHILALALFLSVNVLIQGIADVALKLFSYTDYLTPLPWRTDFLFLTAISVLMGYNSLQGLRHKKFDMTKYSMELGVLVETSLVVGDVLFVHAHVQDIPEVFAMRIPFIVLTAINICILIYNYIALHTIQLFLPRVSVTGSVRSLSTVFSSLL